jgi:hypothetical protein
MLVPPITRLPNTHASNTRPVEPLGMPVVSPPRPSTADKVAEEGFRTGFFGNQMLWSKIANSGQKPASIKDSHKEGRPRSGPPPLWRKALGLSLEFCSKAYNSDKKKGAKKTFCDLMKCVAKQSMCLVSIESTRNLNRTYQRYRGFAV